jgi:tRNA dimethylallyltransferase
MSLSDASDEGSLRVIAGPTGAGKSAMAMLLASEFGGGIISADSRQVYRGFDIGTGTPTLEERERVPHWGISVADPAERWSAARFAAAADSWIADCTARCLVPVVVGGTGLWIAALVKPLAPVPELDPDARAALEAELAARSHEELKRWCAQLDPGLVRLGPVQWRRAIEVALLTGRRLSDWQRDASAQSPPRPVRYLVLDPGAALDGRIAARVDAMFAAGWVAEVRRLMSAVPPGASAWRACGYVRLRDAVASGLDPASVRDAIVRETRQYARRQRTWLRRQLAHGPVTRLDPLEAGAVDRARAWWNGDRHQ